jgi:hypothetical protein
MYTEQNIPDSLNLRIKFCVFADIETGFRICVFTLGEYGKQNRSINL